VTLIESQTTSYLVTIWVSLAVVSVMAVDFPASPSVTHYLPTEVVAAADSLSQYWKNFHWNYSELQQLLPAVNKKES
jgi:hypothetical protein